jgi:hypothetical protein
MNGTKRAILVCYALAVALACLWVPWRGPEQANLTIFVGYDWLWSGPTSIPSQHRSEEYYKLSTIDYGRMALEILALTAISSIAFLVTPGRASYETAVDAGKSEQPIVGTGRSATIEVGPASVGPSASAPPKPTWRYNWGKFHGSLAFRKVLWAIGKALLAVALGCVAWVVGMAVLAFLLGALHGLFGWPVPTSTTQDLILLSIFVICLLIYRERQAYKERRKQYP